MSFIRLSDLNGLNTSEVSYAGAPTLEEQMLLFHSGPMDVVPETIETVKEDQHKQQAIDPTVLRNSPSQCLDPDEPCQNKSLGDLSQDAGSDSPRRNGNGDVLRLLLPFAAGVLAGAFACHLAAGRR